ncbi:MAG: hypothetical protein ACKOB3_03680, partial [Holophagaceae bacterium]
MNASTVPNDGNPDIDLSYDDVREEDDNQESDVYEDAVEDVQMEQVAPPATHSTTKKKCDWREIGMCVLIGQDAQLDKCQYSLGRCKALVHHLCQILYVEKSGLGKSQSLAKLCRAHCPEYLTVMSGAKAKSPPEKIIPMATVNQAQPLTTEVMDTTNEALTFPVTQQLPPTSKNIVPKSTLSTPAVKHPNARDSAATNEAPEVPILPPFPAVAPLKPTHWTCSKCHIELTVTKKRCGNCRNWQGGKR